MKSFTFLFLTSFFLISCYSKEKETAMNNVSLVGKMVSLEKQDSIQIYYLGNPAVHDLDPISRKVLFMEHMEFSEEIILADFKGNILSSFSKLGDIPDSYGGLMSTLRIEGDSTFKAYGYNGFLTYDFSGRLKSRVKLKDFQVPNLLRKEMGFGMEKFGKRYLYHNQGSRKIDYTSIDIYEEMTLMNWLDYETGEKEAFIRFPKTSIFRNGKYFFRDSWTPVFTLADEQIYLAFGIEPVIYIYETTPPYSLVSSISLDLPDYRYFKGRKSYSSLFNYFDFWRTSGRILNIKKIDGYFVVAYFQGYNTLDTEREFENKSPKEAKVFNEQVKKKYPPRVAIFDSVGTRLSDFVPEGLRASSMLVRNGELWMSEEFNRETERDYFRLFRMRLKVN